MSYNDDTVSILNPITREVWEVPRSPLLRGHGFITYGFTYDLSTDDYKIVSVALHDAMSIGIYSLRNNSWRKLLPNPPYYEPDVYPFQFALINQNFHWLASAHQFAGHPFIVVFSLATEEFNEIKLPDSILNNELVWIIEPVDVGGKLGIFVCIGGVGYELWEYGVGDSWTKFRFNIHGRYRDLIGPMSANINLINPVCFVEGSNKFIVLDYGYEVVVYSIDERRFRDLRIVGGPSRIAVGGAYVETIESPRRIITPPYPVQY